MYTLTIMTIEILSSTFFIFFPLQSITVIFLLTYKKNTIYIPLFSTIDLFGIFMKNTLYLFAFSLATAFASGSVVMATNEDAFQGKGHTVSQNPKAPLTGQQLNNLPADIQANISRMLKAKQIDTKTGEHTDTKDEHLPQPGTYEVNEFNHEKVDEFSKRQQELQKKPLAGTPLAEGVLKNKINETLKKTNYTLTIDSLETLKKINLEYKDYHNPKHPLIYAFTDATDFIDHYEQYQPFLAKCGMIHLYFHKQLLNLENLTERLNTFSDKFLSNKPANWPTNAQVLVKLS